MIQQGIETSENEQKITDITLNDPKIDTFDLLKKVPNRFLLSVAIAKRARQIIEGEKPLVDFVPNKPINPISIAMKEIKLDLIQISKKEAVDDELELIEKLDKNLDKKLENKEEPPKGKDKKKSKLLSK